VLFFFPGIHSPRLASFLLGGLIQTVVLGGLVLGFARGKSRAPFTYLGLTRFSWRDLLITGIVGGSSIFSLVILVMALIISILPHYPQPQPFAELILETREWHEMVIPLILGGILAPLGEELYFRGFIYPVFRSRFGVFPAVLITSIFFAALHFDLVRFFPLALGGAGLTLICEKTGSLFPALAAHSTWNVAMTLLVFLGGHAL
jgi:membrane protease YdiL (CAAX protease family)